LDIIELVLKKGADTNLRDKEGKTALEYFVENHVFQVPMEVEQ